MAQSCSYSERRATTEEDSKREKTKMADRHGHEKLVLRKRKSTASADEKRTGRPGPPARTWLEKEMEPKPEKNKREGLRAMKAG